jgi:hypothetical protein
MEPPDIEFVVVVEPNAGVVETAGVVEEPNAVVVEPNVVAGVEVDEVPNATVFDAGSGLFEVSNTKAPPPVASFVLLG